MRLGMSLEWFLKAISMNSLEKYGSYLYANIAKLIVSKSCSYAYKKFVKKKMLFRNDLLNPIAFTGLRMTVNNAFDSLAYQNDVFQ